MKRFTSLIVFGIFAIVFTACGGSSIEKKIEEKIIEEYAEGVYDISTINDTIYFSIEDDGLVNTYRLDINNNCYRKNESPGLNSSINGRKLDIDYSDRAFEIDSVQWYYGSSEKVSKVRINDLESSEVLESNNIRIATANHITSNITLGELNQSVCE